MPSRRTTRTLRVSQDATLLHLVGGRGVLPGDHDDLRAGGWDLIKVESDDTKITFTYVRKGL